MAKLHGSWRFESKRPKTVVLDAMEHRVESPRAGAVLFSGLDLPSTHFDGFRVTVKNPADVPVTFWALWSPGGTRKGGDYLFRNEARLLPAKSTTVHHFALPLMNPRTGTAWTLDELEVRMKSSALPKDFDVADHVEEVVVFSDPLRRP